MGCGVLCGVFSKRPDSPRSKIRRGGFCRGFSGMRRRQRQMIVRQFSPRLCRGFAVPIRWTTRSSSARGPIPADEERSGEGWPRRINEKAGKRIVSRRDAETRRSKGKKGKGQGAGDGEFVTACPPWRGESSTGAGRGLSRVLWVRAARASRGEHWRSQWHTTRRSRKECE
jgi:hypothetical protein